MCMLSPPPPPSIEYRGVALVEDERYLFNYHIMCFTRLRNILLQNLNFYFFIPMTGQVSHPLLALVAKEFLEVQATSAACERLSSEGYRVINYKRSRLTVESIEVMITLKSWYSNEDLRTEDDDGYNSDDGPLVVNVDSSNI